MPAAKQSTPAGFHTVTPGLVVRGADKAIEYYKKVFNAQELSRMMGADNKVSHAELKIGDSIIFVSDEFPNMGIARSPQSLGGCTGTLHLYVDDVDHVYEQAISLGGKKGSPVADMFWGDRYGTFTDPFGLSWGVATHKEDVSVEEMKKRADAFMASMAEKKTA